MKNGKERQKSGRSVLARILLCMMTVWILTGCGSDRTHRRDALREEGEQKKENYDLKDEEKDDTKDNLIVTYVEQHDDSVGGSEVQIRDGVIVQNCKYHDHAPLMASNGAAPQRLY